MDTLEALPAGNFSEWLREMRRALAGDGGMDVACGDCRGCCVSSYYVKVRAHEARAMARIGDANLEPGPPRDPGSRLLGFRADGQCRMLVAGNCSIYEDRPETCRSYDCRVYAAAGMDAGPDKPVINQRVARWRFEFPEARDRDELAAVRAAASFLRQHPVRFPGGHVPSKASEIAVLAVKAYPVFMGPAPRHGDAVAGIIEACSIFDRKPA
jgi:hypothetical protein